MKDEALAHWGLLEEKKPIWSRETLLIENLISSLPIKNFHAF
jgi:hypothetical protein